MFFLSKHFLQCYIADFLFFLVFIYMISIYFPIVFFCLSLFINYNASLYRLYLLHRIIFENQIFCAKKSKKLIDLRY